MIKNLTFSFLMLAASFAVAQDLPVTFDNGSVTYTLTDFGGNSSSVVADPTGGSNKVARSEKTGTAETWAGTTIGPPTGFTVDIPFTASETKMTIRVYSPKVGLPVRLKVEDKTDQTKSVETEATTTKANEWETLTFDFSNQAAGTAVINLSYKYNKASVFFNFNTSGAAAGAMVFFWDDVEFAKAGPVKKQITLPVTFDDTTVNYALTDFGGNLSSIVADPVGGMNMVAKSVKSNTAESWAGTTAGGNFGFKDAIPFVTGSTKMTVRIYSPVVGIPVRLKVEMSSDPTKSVETEAMTTLANAWEYLEFDFSKEASGTAKINLATPYNKPSIFYNFGKTGAVAGEQTFYWDDIAFGSKPASISGAFGSEINYFPNPFNNTIQIANQNNIDKVLVFNTVGQQVTQFDGGSNNLELDLSTLNTGVYHFVIQQNGMEYSFRAVKN